MDHGQRIRVWQRCDSECRCTTPRARSPISGVRTYVSGRTLRGSCTFVSGVQSELVDLCLQYRYSQRLQYLPVHVHDRDHGTQQQQQLIELPSPGTRRGGAPSHGTQYVCRTREGRRERKPSTPAPGHPDTRSGRAAARQPKDDARCTMHGGRMTHHRRGQKARRRPWQEANKAALDGCTAVAARARSRSRNAARHALNEGGRQPFPRALGGALVGIGQPTCALRCCRVGSGEWWRPVSYARSRSRSRSFESFGDSADISQRSAGRCSPTWAGLRCVPTTRSTRSTLSSPPSCRYRYRGALLERSLRL